MPGDEHPAAVHADDAIAHLGDQGDVVLDEHDRHAGLGRDLGEQRGERSRLGLGQTGGGLVEQQQPGPLGEHRGELHQAQRAVGELVGPGVGERCEVDDVHDRLDVVASRGLLAA